MKKIPPKPGRLLLSEPFLTDLHFKRSVILLTEHSAEGSLGFVLNKPISLNINDAIEDFPSFDAPLYLGGPVRNDSLFFIHTLGDKLSGSVQIRPGLFRGGDFEQLQSLVLTDRISARDIRFFVGYSGWAPRQLNSELKQQSWLVAQGEINHIMQEETDNLWQLLVKEMGNEYDVLSRFPDNPSLN